MWQLSFKASKQFKDDSLSFLLLFVIMSDT